MKLIAALPAGATLGLIAPAGPPKPGQLEQVPALLQAHGFKAKVFQVIRADIDSIAYALGHVGITEIASYQGIAAW